MALPKFTTTKHTDQSAMRAIQKLLDGVEWSPTTVSAIASIVIDAGYCVRDCYELDSDLEYALEPLL